MASSTDIYAAFNRRLEHLERVLHNKFRSFLGYSKGDLVWRVLQRFAATFIFDFKKISASKYRDDGALPENSKPVGIGGFSLENGSLRISSNRFLYMLAEFSVFWFWAAIIIFLSLRRHNGRKFTLLYGLGREHLFFRGSDERFVDFCNYGNLAPLKQADTILVKYSKKVQSSDTARVRFCREPLFTACMAGGLGLPAWLRALFIHLAVLLRFMHMLCLDRRYIFVGRDLASHSIAGALNTNKSLQDIVFNNSNYFSQPLWSVCLRERSFITHLTWYSQNNYPISFRGKELMNPISNLRFLRVDIHWVWTDGFRKFLEENCMPSVFKVVGPIVYCRPASRVPTPLKKTRVITLFDVVPVNVKTERELGLIDNIYNEENGKRFLTDIISTVNEMRSQGDDISIKLKHKRNPSTLHSDGYLRFVDELCDAGTLTVVPEDENIFDFIDGADLVISFPFSSPVYVASYRGKKAIWYDPSSKVAKLRWEDGIELLSGHRELRKFLLKYQS